MARLQPRDATTLGIGTRFWFWLSRRLFGRVLAPYGVAAHAPRMVPALSLMSAFFGAGRWEIGSELRTLIHLRVAQIVGCVF